MPFFKSIFQSNFINPSEYTINSKNGSCIYIKDEVVKSNSLLSELCNIVCPQVSATKSNLKLIVQSSKTVLDITSKHADRFYAEALKTNSISEFFKNIEIVKSDYTRMSEIEQYVYYGTAPSNIALYQLNERLQIEIRHLIDRAYAHSQKLKNPVSAGKKQFTEFQEYISVMDEKSIKKLNSKYSRIFQDKSTF